MIAPDFSTMTKAELRAYVVAHPSDKIAFHAFVARFTAESSPETFDLPRSNAEIDDVESLIKQRLEQLR